jgi:hypothetical protein
MLLKRKNKQNLRNSVKKTCKNCFTKTAFQTQFFDGLHSIKRNLMYYQIHNYVFYTSNIKATTKQTDPKKVNLTIKRRCYSTKTIPGQIIKNNSYPNTFAIKDCMFWFWSKQIRFRFCFFLKRGKVFGKRERDFFLLTWMSRSAFTYLD